MLQMISLVAVLLLSLARPVYAQDDAELRAAAEAYVDHPVVQQVGDELSSEVVRVFFASLSQSLGDVLSDDGLEALVNIASEEMQRIRPTLTSHMVTAVIQTFELDEIQALQNFLDTDAGARAHLKSAAFVQAFYANAQSLLQEASERVSTRVVAELLN